VLPELTPQIVVTAVVDPPTVKVSVQVPTVVPVVDGPPMVKDTKSSLKLETNIVNNFCMKSLNLFLLHQCLLGKSTYRIWQMGLFNCSTNLVSNLTVNAQVEGALTAVDGDCQNVLFVTVPPQVLIESFV
jgi:hypothetical protein